MSAFHKKVIQVTVLSDGYFSGCELDAIRYEITEGSCVGVVKEISNEEISPKEMAQALNAAGSSPEFFNLDDDGNALDD